MTQAEDALRVDEFAQALGWFTEAASLGSPPAMVAAGRLHEHGRGTARNASEALRWYRTSALRGNAEAKTHMALLLLREKRTDTSMPAPLAVIQAAAKEGIAYALYAMGWLHQQGVALHKDESIAAEWFEKAANRGEPLAQLALAIQYLEGKGIADHPRMAAIWFDEAARHGETEAQARLGVLFRDGWGVERDELEAVYWLNRAAESGHPAAMTALAEIQTEGRGPIRKEPEKALPLLKKAAAAGDARAKYLLGVLLVEARVPEADAALGMKMLKEAAESGIDDARAWLARMPR